MSIAKLIIIIFIVIQLLQQYHVNKYLKNPQKKKYRYYVIGGLATIILIVSIVIYIQKSVIWAILLLPSIYKFYRVLTDKTTTSIKKLKWNLSFSFRNALNFIIWLNMAIMYYFLIGIAMGVLVFAVWQKFITFGPLVWIVELLDKELDLRNQSKEAQKLIEQYLDL